MTATRSRWSRTLGAWRRRRRDTNERGVVLVTVTLLLAVMMIFVALVVDIGHASEERRQAQAAADAAAIAAARDTLVTPVSWPTVVGDAKLYASQDLGVPASAWVGCSDASALSYKPDNLNTDSCISADSSATPTRVRVHIPTTSVQTAFAPVIGVSSLHVGASATASIAANENCSLCVLSPSASPALSGTGNGTVTVNSGSIVVDSTANPAARLTHNGSVVAVSIGGPAAPAGFVGSGLGHFSPTPVHEAAELDPLSGLPPCPAAGTGSCPTTVQPNVNLSGTTPMTINPGIYGSISDTGTGQLTLNPGTYIVTQSLSVAGNGPVSANGVTLYFACSAYPTPCSGGQAGASFNLSGNGTLTVSAPTVGPFNGLSIFSDRNNAATSSISGNAGSVGGSVYMAAGSLTLTGNGQAIETRVIVNTVTLSGDSSLTVNAGQTGSVAGQTVSLSG
jgi:hypothetical protein